MIVHHPSDMILAEFANSSLDEAAALVVGAHITQCTECQKNVRKFEVLGGAIIEGSDTDARLQVDADTLLARGEAGLVVPETVDVSIGTRASGADELLSLYENGNWRWVGPGIYWRKIFVPSNQGIRVFMLKAKGGTSLPHHKHSGVEWTSVLDGAFEHAHGRFGAGDFDEADSSVEHDPVVEKGRDCVCLVAMNGRLELQGFLGRVLQPFVRL